VLDAKTDEVALKTAEVVTKTTEEGVKISEKTIEADLDLKDSSIIEQIANTTIAAVDEKIKADKQKEADILTAEKVALEAEETALKAEEVILIAARDSAVDIEAIEAAQLVLDAKTDEVALKTAEVVTKTTKESVKISEATTNKVNDTITDLTTEVSQAVANINTQIDAIIEFNEAATDILNIGAEKLADQVSEAVQATAEKILAEAQKVSLELEETALKAEEVILIAARDSAEGAEAIEAAQLVLDAKTLELGLITADVVTKTNEALEKAANSDLNITLAAETLITTHEDETISITVNGTSASSTVNDNGDGFYGDLTFGTENDVWVYTLHAGHGQALNEMEVYDETFVITDADATTHEVTVVLVGKNDTPVITSAAQTGAVTEDDAAANTATGTITSSDADADDTAAYSGEPGAAVR
jgi:VCBS repeat-containing protein